MDPTKRSQAFCFRCGAESIKGVITIVNQGLSRRVPRARFAEWLCRPRRGRMSGDGEVDDAPSIVGEKDQHEQQSIGHSRNQPQGSFCNHSAIFAMLMSSV
jgi:hypothetical protein